MLSKLRKNHSLYKNFSWLSLLRINQQILALVSTYFLVRLLSTEEMGIYAFILSSLPLLSFFCLPGIANTITQTVSRGKLFIYRDATRISFLFSFTVSFIFIILFFFNFQKIPSEISILIAILFPFSHGLLFWQSYMSGKELFARLSILLSIQSVITYLFIIYFAHFDENNLIFILAIYFIVPSIFNITMTFRYMKIKMNYENTRKEIIYGTKNSVYILINAIGNHLDKLIIAYFVSIEATALFFIAEKFPEIIKKFVQDFFSVQIPHFAKLELLSESKKNEIKNHSLLISVTLIVFTFTIFPFFYEILFPSLYLDGLPISQALIISVAIGVNSMGKMKFIQSKIDSKSIKKITLYSSAIRIFFTILFVPLFSLWGAVLSSILYRIFLNYQVSDIIHQRYKGV